MRCHPRQVKMARFNTPCNEPVWSDTFMNESHKIPTVLIVLDGWGWLGMAVIASCGAASAWLNMRSAADKQRPVSTVQADTIAD